MGFSPYQMRQQRKKPQELPDVRLNTTGNERTGQKFRTVRSGDSYVHVYESGQRVVVPPKHLSLAAQLANAGAPKPKPASLPDVTYKKRKPKRRRQVSGGEDSL